MVRKNNWRKQGLSLLLVFVTVLTLLPSSVYADGTAEEEGAGGENGQNSSTTAPSVSVAWTPQAEEVKTGETGSVRLTAQLDQSEADNVSAEVSIWLNAEEASALQEIQGNTIKKDEQEDGRVRLYFSLNTDQSSIDQQIAFQAGNGITAPFSVEITEDDIEISTASEGEADVTQDKQGGTFAFTADLDWSIEAKKGQEQINSADGKLEDFSFSVNAAASNGQGTAGVLYAASQTLEMTLTLPEGIQFPEGEYNYDQSRGEVLAGTQKILQLSGLPENTAITDVSRQDGRTLTFQLNRTAPDTESSLSDMELEITVTGNALTEAGETADTAAVSLNAEMTVVSQADEGITCTGESQADIQVVKQEQKEEETNPKETENEEKKSSEVSALSIPAGTDVTIGDYRESESYTVYWVDNNDESSIRPEASEYQQPSLYFILKDAQGNPVGSQQELTQETMDEVGLDQIPELTVAAGSGNTYTVTVPGNTLPSTVTYEDIYGTETVYTVEWTVSPKETDGYSLVNVTDDNHNEYPSAAGNGWYYVLNSQFQFQIEILWGNLGSAEGITQQILEQFQLTVGTSQNDYDYKLGDIPDTNLTLTPDDPDAENPTSGTITITGLWKYNLDGSLVAYQIEEIGDNKDGQITGTDLPEAGLEEGDYFSISYDNSDAPNYGNITDVLHDGGTLYLTLTGETDYTATKNWLDSGEEIRPDGEFQLWRYREGESYSTASPVRDSQGQIMTVELSKEDSQTISFAGLPKYDQEGYRYIYVVREYLESVSTGENSEETAADSYEQVFGKVEEDGTTADTGADGGEYEDRPSGDTFVYQGGTLSNRVTGNVSTEATKTWEAYAFQSEFDDVTVVLKLQSRLVGSSSEEDWEDALRGGSVVTETLDSFTAENLAAVTVDESMPKYDALGRELEYRWVESAVYQGEDSEDNLLGEDGYFTLTQDGRKVLYQSALTVTGDGTSENPFCTQITNSIANTIDYDVEKIWQDENGEEIEAPEGASVTFGIYRVGSGETLDASSKPVAEFTIDGTADESAVTVNEELGITAQETEAWKVTVTPLAQFDEQGREYEYVLLETGNNTPYYPTYETERDDEGNYTTRVINAPGTGNRILVGKQWIDESDISHREAVTIGVYERETNELVNTVTLENGVWQSLVGIGKLEPEDVYILEIKAGETDLDLSDKEGAEDQPDCPVFDTGGNDDYTAIRYETDNHRYEATYYEPTIVAGEALYTVANRRLGTVNVTATKSWIDGDGTRREEIQEALEDLPEGKKLTLNLRLYFADYEDNEDYTIDYENDTVTIGGATDHVQIRKPQETEDGLTDPDSLTDGKATYEVDLTKGSSTYYFWNLPKYNRSGGVAHYTVKEVWLDETGKEITLSDMSQDPDYADLYALVAEYTCTYEETYKTSNLHDQDDQTVEITNKLTGTKSAMWHKQWNDVYSQTTGQRPDLYLNIYAVRHVENDLDMVETETELYLANYKWEYSELAGSEGNEDGKFDENWHWHAVLDGLPKYDDLGYEIQYYAVEHTSVDASRFDYEEAQYGMPASEGSADVTAIGTESEIDSEYLIEDCDYVVDVTDLEGAEETTYALREDGTFTNSLSDTVTIQGQKLWSNLPSGYPSVDLPTVTFALDQYLPLEDGEADPEGDDDGLKLVEKAYSTLTVSEWASICQNGSYQFQILYQGTNTMTVDGDGNVTITGPDGEDSKELPEYDEQGRQYSYKIREESIQWTYEDGTSGTGPDGDQVFDISVADNTYLVNNSYDSDKGSLSFKKILQLPVGEDGAAEAYPAVRFRITRTYTTNTGETSQSETVETVIWSAEEIQAAYETAAAGGDSAGLLEKEFQVDDLEIYAPNGSTYIYTVTEVRTWLDGYDTWVADSEIQLDDAKDYMDQKPAEAAGEELVASEAVNLTPYEGETPSETVPVSATFLNRREAEPQTVTLTGEKVWEDYENAFDLRPEKLQLTLYRYADTQPGEDNGIDRMEVPSDLYTITWDTTGSDDTWTYTITGKDEKGELERYAPNGMPWRYVVKETLGEETYYHSSPSSQEVGEKQAAEDQSEMNTLTNSILTEVPFQKEWTDEDGNVITEDYLGYDLEVVFTLQAATLTGEGEAAVVGEWEDAESYLSNNLSEEDYQSIFSGYAFTQTITGRVNSDVWSRGETFEGLPSVIKTKDGDTLQVIYRVVESEIRYGNTVITATPVDSVDNRTYTYEFTINGEPSGIITPGYVEGDSNDASTEIHRNCLSTTEFTVTKQWQGDRGNIYGTRPDTESVGDDWETIFVIQRTTTPKSEESWGNVPDGDGRSLIVYVTGANADERASASVSGLPQQNENGETYYYRARELQPAEDRYIDGEVTDEDIVAEDGTYHDAYTASYTDDLEHGTGTTAVNTLKSTKIYAVKNWYGKENTSVTLELQYLTENGQWTSFPTAASVTLDGTTDPNPSTPWYEYESWQAVWENVPSVYPGSALTEGGRTQYRVVETLQDGYIQINFDTQIKEEGGKEYTEWVFTNVASTSLTVTKAWYEIAAADQQAVTVELWRTTGTIGDSASEPVKDADGDVQTLTLTAGNQWTGTFSDLPKYDADGQPYTYYAAETKIGDEPAEDSGYRIVYTYGGSAAGGFTVSIANIGRTEVTGTKTWVDNGNAYGTRPDTLELKLYRSTTGADGSWAEVSAQTLAEEEAELIWSNTDTDVWTYRYGNLPAADDDGNPYQYRAEEVTPETVTEEDTYKGTSETTADGANFTNTLTGTVDIPVSKIWQDGSDADGERPKEVTLILYADGVEKERITLTADNADAGKDRWSYTFTGLDKYDSTGKQITYTVGEAAVPDGYEASADQGSYTVTNVLLTSLSVRKVWGGVPEEDQEDVTVALYRSIEGQEEEAVTDGQGNVLTLTLTAQGNWTGTFTDIPRFDEDGNRYSYTVREISIGGRPSEESDYIIHIGKDKNGAVVSNIAKTFLTGVKIWRDEQNAYGTRPETLKLTLWRQIEGGEKEQAEATPVWDNTDSDTWTYTFENLPVTDDEGNPYTYWVTEEVPEEYELTQQEGNRFVNTLKDTIDISVEKLWTDQNNMRGIRPSSIEVALYADGQEVERAELSRENGWSRTFPELEEYDETGRRIQYEVKETQVPDGYKVSYSGGTQEGFIIENTREDLAGGSLAKTGDGANLAGYAGLMLISGTVFAVTVTGKKRKKKGNR